MEYGGIVVMTYANVFFWIAMHNFINCKKMIFTKWSWHCAVSSFSDNQNDIDNQH